MSFKDYRYLNISDGSGSETTDANGVTIYTLDLTSTFSTEGVGLDGRPVTYELIGTGLTGSGVVKLQFSIDGILWTDAVDGDGNAITYTLSSATLTEVYKDFQVVGTAQKWVCSTASDSGTLTIKVS